MSLLIRYICKFAVVLFCVPMVSDAVAFRSGKSSQQSKKVSCEVIKEFVAEALNFPTSNIVYAESEVGGQKQCEADVVPASVLIYPVNYRQRRECVAGCHLPQLLKIRAGDEYYFLKINKDPFNVEINNASFLIRLIGKDHPNGVVELGTVNGTRIQAIFPVKIGIADISNQKMVSGFSCIDPYSSEEVLEDALDVESSNPNYVGFQFMKMAPGKTLISLSENAICRGERDVAKIAYDGYVEAFRLFNEMGIKHGDFSLRNVMYGDNVLSVMDWGGASDDLDKLIAWCTERFCPELDFFLDVMEKALRIKPRIFPDLMTRLLSAYDVDGGYSIRDVRCDILRACWRFRPYTSLVDFDSSIIDSLKESVHSKKYGKFLGGVVFNLLCCKQCPKEYEELVINECERRCVLDPKFKYINGNDLFDVARSLNEAASAKG
ncbi:MAG: hypothetical protein LBQ43_02945 [Holosporales bacterium]|jgi:hypothetical protein|nr:hypothetical protein [Holosporales bacterium]